MASVANSSDGLINLTFRIAEGHRAKVGTAVVSGNHYVPATEILALLPLRTGNLFSRATLIASRRALAGSSKFDPTKIAINPQLVPQLNAATGLVDITFVVIEK